MRVVITGGATATPDPTVVETPAAVDLRITAEDGSVTTIVGGPVAVRRTVPGVPVQITTKIQTVTDSSGRTWTVAADGRSATAIA